MSDRTDYSDLTREQLEERLRLAEDVCVLVAWTAARSGSDRDDALTELWMRWSRGAGDGATDRRANPHLNDDAVRALAEQRHATREATLTRLAVEASR